MGSETPRKACYHVLVLAYNLWCYYYYYVYVYEAEMNAEVRPSSHVYGGDTKYLTMWCWFFQIFYFFSCCVTDLVEAVSAGGKGSISQRLAVARDWFLCSVAFPIALMVAMMFWSLWSIDRELVFPQALDEVFPMWLNHVLHTNLLPILLVDMWLVRHKQPSRRLGLAGLFFVTALYLSWIMWLGFVMDIWVYPILHVLDGLHFALFLILCCVVLIPIYFLGEWCITTIHGPACKKQQELEKAD